MKKFNQLAYLAIVVSLISCGAPQVASKDSQSAKIPSNRSNDTHLYGSTKAQPRLMNMQIQSSHVFVEPRLPRNTERYQHTDDNPVHSTANNAVSTFSIDVDTGSFSNVRRFLNEGRLPPEDAVRVEEIVNYFNYTYPLPTGSHPFSVHTQTVDSPWKHNAKLMRIGIKAQDLPYGSLPPANLVFLVDVSGSMQADNKLNLVKKTLRILTNRLRVQDKITIITYASGEQLALPTVTGRDKDKILSVINQLKAGGATAGEAALQMAYQEAQKSFIRNGINRIFLATDGDFNVGVSDTQQLIDLVKEKRKSGISLTTLGFGTGNYNEAMMERIADAGDGNYSYIDNEKEARKVLDRQLSSTLATVAQDVKIQVEFNPATVKEYRLVGYENRMLRNEDFNNDQVDAGDIGSGHTVTAFYEIIEQGQSGWLNESRYQKSSIATGSANEYAQVLVRYKKPGAQQSVLMRHVVPTGSLGLNQASDDTRLAVAAASYAQKLRGGAYSGSQSWEDIARLAKNARSNDQYGLRQDLIDLIEIAQSISTSAK